MEPGFIFITGRHMGCDCRAQPRAELTKIQDFLPAIRFHGLKYKPENPADAMGCLPHARFDECDPDPAATRLRRGFLSDSSVQPVIAPGSRFQTETKGFPSGGKEHPSRGRAEWDVTIIMRTISEQKTQPHRRGFGLVFAKHGTHKSSRRDLFIRPAPQPRPGSQRNRSTGAKRHFGLEPKHGSNRCGLQPLLRWGQRHLHQRA